MILMFVFHITLADLSVWATAIICYSANKRPWSNSIGSEFSVTNYGTSSFCSHVMCLSEKVSLKIKCHIVNQSASSKLNRLVIWFLAFSFIHLWALAPYDGDVFIIGTLIHSIHSYSLTVLTSFVWFWVASDRRKTWKVGQCTLRLDTTSSNPKHGGSDYWYLCAWNSFWTARKEKQTLQMFMFFFEEPAVLG